MGLKGLHHLGFLVYLVIVPQEMKASMHNQVRQMRIERLSVPLRLRRRRLEGKYHIAHDEGQQAIREALLGNDRTFVGLS